MNAQRRWTAIACATATVFLLVAAIAVNGLAGLEMLSWAAGILAAAAAGVALIVSWPPRPTTGPPPPSRYPNSAPGDGSARSKYDIDIADSSRFHIGDR